jgi:hypothetical protein
VTNWSITGFAVTLSISDDERSVSVLLSTSILSFLARSTVLAVRVGNSRGVSLNVALECRTWVLAIRWLRIGRGLASGHRGARERNPYRAPTERFSPFRNQLGFVAARTTSDR